MEYLDGLVKVTETTKDEFEVWLCVGSIELKQAILFGQVNLDIFLNGIGAIA